ncbi:MAG: Wzz/FepE/Etk N-terminal domain-containing protein [Bacillota bacterium]|nr:Wzz/FepE/Etk N-terminal domain-containing protein [Bacillota bacterium]
MEENNVDIGQFLDMIKGGKVVIITITLVAVIISAILSFFVIPPTYEAQASIIIAKNNDSTNINIKNDDVMMYQNLVKTYAEIAKSNAVAEKTASKLNNGMSMGDVEKNITVTPQDGTQILIITAEADKAEDAANIVNTLSQEFIDYSKQVYSAGDIKIIDKADVPTAPVKPKKVMNIAIAFFLGLMLSIGLVFLIEFMDSTIKSQEDVKKYLDLPVLGMIPNNTEM